MICHIYVKCVSIDFKKQRKQQGLRSQNIINCNGQSVYREIFNTLVKREHLHQIFRPRTTRNEIIPIMWLHATQSAIELLP